MKTEKQLYFGNTARLHNHGGYYYLSLRYGTGATQTATYFLVLWQNYTPTWNFLATRPSSTMWTPLDRETYENLRKIF
ncbi:MAG: hypothetical protein ABI417_11065 [Coleofasciculaceae cyanobacterium]